MVAVGWAEHVFILKNLFRYLSCFPRDRLCYGPAKWLGPVGDYISCWTAKGHGFQYFRSDSTEWISGWSVIFKYICSVGLVALVVLVYGNRLFLNCPHKLHCHSVSATEYRRTQERAPLRFHWFSRWYLGSRHGQLCIEPRANCWLGRSICLCPVDSRHFVLGRVHIYRAARCPTASSAGHPQRRDRFHSGVHSRGLG